MKALDGNPLDDWGDIPNEPDVDLREAMMNGAFYEAATDKDRRVKVWKGPDTGPEHLRYFCHGHALGTFERFQYTVCSGQPMEDVLVDEHKLIKPGKGKSIFDCNPFDPERSDEMAECLDQLQVGSIIAWMSRQGQMPHHTARVIGLPDGVRTTHNITMTTKNGLLNKVKTQSMRVINDLYTTKCDLAFVTFWTPHVLLPQLNVNVAPRPTGCCVIL